MLHKTRGVALHVTDYSETSVVVRIYTELFGAQSYLINNVRSTKAKVKANLLQPLTLLDLVVYHKPARDLQRVKEIKALPVLQHIPYDVGKSSISFFIAEILYKVLREEEANDELFDFLFHAIQLLDLQTLNYSVFHHTFLLQLTKYLGFFPHGAYSTATPIFNLSDGLFQSTAPIHPYYLTSTSAEKISLLLNASFEKAAQLGFPYELRKEMLQNILLYYKLHLHNFGELRSLAVLEEVMG
jgi:DNA repair protein RecO (recombination protein O)